MSGIVNSIRTRSAVIGIPPSEKAHGFSMYMGSGADYTNNAWVEAGSHDSGNWVVRWASHNQISNGRWTPGKPGAYLCGYSVQEQYLDQNERLRTELRRNGNETNGATIFASNFSWSYNSSDYTEGNCGSSIVIINNQTDYVSLWVFQESGSNNPLVVNRTEFWGTYYGAI